MSKWEEIKEWSGLPKEQRQWASFAIVIVALSTAISSLYLAKEAGARNKDSEIKQLNEIIRIADAKCDSVVSANNDKFQRKFDEMVAENKADDKEQILELKRNQAKLEALLDKTITRSQQILVTQEKTSKKLKKTINQLSR